MKEDFYWILHNGVGQVAYYSHGTTGDHTEFCVASDREVTSHEIVEAANKLLK